MFHMFVLFVVSYKTSSFRELDTYTQTHSRPPWRRWVEGVTKIALGSDPLPPRDLYLII